MGPHLDSKAAKGKAAPRKKKSALPAPEVTGTLDEQMHFEQTKKRKGEKESVDTRARRMVRKCIRDNLGSLTESELHNVLVDKRSCFQRLLEDKTLAMLKEPNAPTFGNTYFAEIRAAYTVAQDIEGLQVGEDKDINAELLDAVDDSRSNLKRDKLIRFCTASQHKPHQGEVCGMLTHAMEIKAVPCNVQINLAIIKWVRRLDIHSSFPAEFAAFVTHVDQVLQGVHAAMKAKGFKNSAFWTPHRQLCEMYMPVEAVDRLFGCNGSWAGHEADIELVCRTGLGVKMFGYAHKASQSHKVGVDVVKAIQALDKVDVTSELVENTMQEVLASLKAEGLQPDEYDKPRVIVVRYRTSDLKLKVGSLWEEITLRMSAYLKTRAGNTVKDDENDHPILVPFLLENELDQLPKPDKVGGMDEDVVASFNACRRAANEQITPARQRSGEAVSNFLENNLEVLTMLDSSVTLEAAFFQMLYTSGAKERLQTMVLGAMPTEDARGSAQAAVSKLDNLRKTALFAFANPEAHASVNIVVEWCKCLAALRPPNLKVTMDEFLTKVKGKLHFFIHVETSTDGAAKATVFGEAALSQIVSDIHAKFEADEAVSLKDLQQLDAFGWMLTADQKKLHQGWVKNIFAKSGASAAASSCSAASFASAKPTGKTKAVAGSTKPKAGHAKTMDLFKKSM